MAQDTRELSLSNNGYLRAARSSPAPQYAASKRITDAKLPPTVDLRQWMPPIEDQGQLSSCVANATVGAYEYLEKVAIKDAHAQVQDLSRLFVYYNARLRSGDQNSDDGCIVEYAMESLGKFGVCTEATWPYKKKLTNKRPPEQAYAEAKALTTRSVKQVPLKLQAWKQALAESNAIVFGCATFESFDECSDNGGLVPMPSPSDARRASHGGHSMLAVGYNDQEQVFIIRNSWGTDWGDQGYCYMPYNYLMSPVFGADDGWVLTGGTALPAAVEKTSWITDFIKVIFGGKGSPKPTNPFSVADYSSLTSVNLFKDITVPATPTPPAIYVALVTAAAALAAGETDVEFPVDDESAELEEDDIDEIDDVEDGESADDEASESDDEDDIESEDEENESEEPESEDEAAEGDEEEVTEDADEGDDDEEEESDEGTDDDEPEEEEDDGEDGGDDGDAGGEED